ncbi:unnamed protein product [Leptosia nina]|uniref:Uncharacterized protein n=1 Tax=Leptosia nina TaxID=320188 RepID=A0AAV1K0U4_9NEOP
MLVLVLYGTSLLRKLDESRREVEQDKDRRNPSQSSPPTKYMTRERNAPSKAHYTGLRYVSTSRRSYDVTRRPHIRRNSTVHNQVWQTPERIDSDTGRCMFSFHAKRPADKPWLATGYIKNLRSQIEILEITRVKYEIRWKNKPGL